MIGCHCCRLYSISKIGNRFTNIIISLQKIIISLHKIFEFCKTVKVAYFWDRVYVAAAVDNYCRLCSDKVQTLSYFLVMQNANINLCKLEELVSIVEPSLSKDYPVSPLCILVFLLFNFGLGRFKESRVIGC